MPLCTNHHAGQTSLVHLPVLSSQFSHPIYSLRGTQSYILPLPPPGHVWKEAQLRRQLFLGQKSALVRAKANSILLAIKPPTTTHFTFVVACLFRDSCRGKLLAWSGFHLRKRTEQAEGGGDNGGSSGVMEKEGKRKGKLEREVMSWLGSGPARSTVSPFHVLGMEASEIPRRVPHIRARRYVRKEWSSVCRPRQKGDKFTLMCFLLY